MKTFNDYTPENLEESTLSRVYTMANDPNRVFAILTAYRGTLSAKENEARNRQLQSQVRKSGYGFFKVDGHWIENEGTPEELEVAEKSFFVSAPKNEDENAFKAFTVKVLKQYDQDAAVIKLGDNNVALVDKSGKVFAQIGKFNINKVATMYSKLRNGKTFVFESASTPDSYFSRLAERESNKLVE